MPGGCLLECSGSRLSTVHSQALGVDIIFGVNGAVWIAPWAPKPVAADLPPAAQQEASDAATAATTPPPPPATPEQRQAVARAANAVRALAALQLPIHAESVTAAVDLAEQVAHRHNLITSCAPCSKQGSRRDRVQTRHFTATSGRPCQPQSCKTLLLPPLQEGVALAHMLRPPFLGMLAAQEAGDRMQTGP
jgi:hypothetical protein